MFREIPEKANLGKRQHCVSGIPTTFELARILLSWNITLVLENSFCLRIYFLSSIIFLSSWNIASVLKYNFCLEYQTLFVIKI